MMAQAALRLEELVSAIFDTNHGLNVGAGVPGPTRRWLVERRGGDIVASRPAWRRRMWLAVGIAVAAVTFALAKPKAILHVLPRLAGYRVEPSACRSTCAASPSSMSTHASKRLTVRASSSSRACCATSRATASRPPGCALYCLSDADGRTVYSMEREQRDGVARAGRSGAVPGTPGLAPSRSAPGDDRFRSTTRLIFNCPR